MIKTILTAAAILLSTVSFAKADDGPGRKCQFNMTKIIQKNSEDSRLVNFQAQPIPPNIRKQIEEKLGAPNVDDPYEMMLFIAEIQGEDVVQVIVHDKDCGLMATRPIPAAAFRSMLGIRDAND